MEHSLQHSQQENHENGEQAWTNNPNPENSNHKYQYQIQQQLLTNDSVMNKVYPAAVASHEEVSGNRDLFFRTLNLLHLQLGTKLTPPKIEGKDLDLHLLYQEVTSRGGLAMVIRARKWKEITLKFNFSPTERSASFVLRKSYIDLLHQYEQLYYFRSMGKQFLPPVLMPDFSSTPQQVSAPEVLSAPSSQVDSNSTKFDTSEALEVDPASSIGAIVTGYIDGKFIHGYLINAMVGARKMRGVLYHLPSDPTPQSAIVSAHTDSSDPKIAEAFTNHKVARRKKRKDICRKDPNAPRQNKTGYNFFFAEQSAKLKSGKPDKDRVICRMIGDLWSNLSEQEKLPYQERGMKERERYRREMSEYKKRLRLECQSKETSQGRSSGLHAETKNSVHFNVGFPHGSELQGTKSEIHHSSQVEFLHQRSKSSHGEHDNAKQNHSYGNSDTTSGPLS